MRGLLGFGPFHFAAAFRTRSVLVGEKTSQGAICAKGTSLRHLPSCPWIQETMPSTTETFILYIYICWVLFPCLAGFATGSSNLHFSMVQKVTFEIVASGLEVRRPQGERAREKVCGWPSVACWLVPVFSLKLESYIFSCVEKVTLAMAVRSREGQVKPSAGCCFPGLRFRKAP